LTALGCGATYNQANKVDGQVYYTQQKVPDLGERFSYSATHDCNGGVRDDARALNLIPSIDGCRREQFDVSYVVDGVHRIEACNERWRIRCNKTPSSRASPQTPPIMAPQGPLDCLVDCFVEDHYVVAE
jgi:hypothetical protein